MASEGTFHPIGWNVFFVNSSTVAAIQIFFGKKLLIRAKPAMVTFHLAIPPWIFLVLFSH